MQDGKLVLVEKGVKSTGEKTLAVVSEIKERCEFVSEIWGQSYYFFEAPTGYDAKTVKKRWKEDTPDKLKEIVTLFESVDSWKADSIKERFSTFMNEKEWGFGAVMNPLRLSLVGGNMGPDLFVICELLGKEESIQRINSAIESIKK